MSDIAAAAPAPDYKYWAFISYSHQDNLPVRGDGSGDPFDKLRAGHLPWANWLHEQLETYRIPDGYRDRATRTGEPMPERFFPAFRDEAELPFHPSSFRLHPFSPASPRSARSRYVDEEVRHFRQLGRGDRILTLIVDGEPNLRLHPKAGWTASDGGGDCRNTCRQCVGSVGINAHASTLKKPAENSSQTQMRAGRN